MGVATPKDLKAYSQGINVNVFTIAKYVRHTLLAVGRTESSGKGEGQVICLRIGLQSASSVITLATYPSSPYEIKQARNLPPPTPTPYRTSNKLLLIARDIMTTGLQKYL